MKIGKYKISIEADNKKAVQEIQEVNDELKNTKTNMEDVDATGDALTGGLVSSFRNVQKGIKTAIGSLKTLKGVLIATGIGAFALAIGAVTAAFTSSEEGQNNFIKITKQIGVVVGNVTDILASFGNAILNVGRYLGAKFKGDAAAAEEAVNGIKDSFKEATDGIKNFGEETRREIETVGKLADAQARGDRLQRRLIVERAKADRERADLLEKAVDRENFTTEQRIGFLQEASALEEEITNKEIDLARIRLNNKIEENKLSGSTKEDLDEEAQLRADLITLETSRLTKQKEVTSQIIGLKNEEKAANDAATKAAQDEITAQEAALQSFEDAEREALAINEDEKRELQVAKTQERYDALIEQAKKFGRDTAALEDARTRAIAQITKTGEEEIVEIVEEEQKNKYDIALKFTALGLSLATEGSNAAKALAIANAIISTYSGAAQVLDDPELGLFAKIAGVATVLATGFTQIRAIKSTDVPVLSVGGVTAGGASSAPAPQIQPPAFNIVGASPINQLTEAIAGQQQEPVRAYVVSNDVTTAQSVDRNIVQTAGI
jgi:hypothetical protein